MPLDFKVWLPGPLLVPGSLEDVPKSRDLSPFRGTGRNTLGGGARNEGEESQEGVLS